MNEPLSNALPQITAEIPPDPLHESPSTSSQPRKHSGQGRSARGEGQPNKEGGPQRKTAKLVGVRVDSSGMVYRFLSTLREIKSGDLVYLHGKEEEILAQVLFVVEAQPGDNLQERLYTGSFDKIGRILSASEKQFVAEKSSLEQKAKQLCRKYMQDLQLEMRLSHIHYQPGGNRIIVYFTAENRVDFRELVRLLGTQLKVRVEMRHIGVRDETKLLGGMGLCGQPFCCASYLKRFHPVSVRMAKNQELSLNPEGISGTCGRLLCCLEYENSTYQALREGMPRLKQMVQTNDGREGVVQAIHPLTETVDLQLADGNRLCVARCDLCLKQQPPPATEEEESLNLEEEEIFREELPAATPPQQGAERRPAETRRQQPRPHLAKRENQRERPNSRNQAAAMTPDQTVAAVAETNPSGSSTQTAAESNPEPTAVGTPPQTRKRRRRRRGPPPAETKETA
ncbi:PSP1 domain-containing protein [Candidatus Magnetaquicoccus inordinatus]|uniref:PSP1 domain-containing protein n=1 Tax=Candidatus Magnetaquicoccus inordinatus TaxID=2496818 RepID=UPI00102B0FDE|nr:regulatory iron-sulfur-containing complex subunit RicT [Candidatus Magnetaquicoccus inordinatus]